MEFGCGDCFLLDSSEGLDGCLKEKVEENGCNVIALIHSDGVRDSFLN